MTRKVGFTSTYYTFVTARLRWSFYIKLLKSVMAEELTAYISWQSDLNICECCKIKQQFIQSVPPWPGDHQGLMWFESQFMLHFYLHSHSVLKSLSHRVLQSINQLLPFNKCPMLHKSLDMSHLRITHL